MASTLRMCTAISPGQWQPWTVVSSLLGLISMACPRTGLTYDHRPSRLLPRQVHKHSFKRQLHITYYTCGSCWKQLSMAATTRVIWLCACIRYWPYRGVGSVYFLLINWFFLNAPRVLHNREVTRGSQ